MKYSQKFVISTFIPNDYRGIPSSFVGLVTKYYSYDLLLNIFLHEML